MAELSPGPVVIKARVRPRSDVRRSPREHELEIESVIVLVDEAGNEELFDPGKWWVQAAS
jgi:hypothetical protein